MNCSMGFTNGISSIVPKTFACSHKLDNNSLQALQHDDDEDQVHHATTSYFNNKQKIKQEALKNFKPGKFLN